MVAAAADRALSGRQAERTWPAELTPHYGICPKDFDENLDFRYELSRFGDQGAEQAAALRWMCSEDLLFFVNAAIWTYDPRKVSKESALYPVVPFLTYPYQDEALLRLDAAIGSKDILIEKSRDMGATWLTLLVFFWRWLYADMQTFLVMSRKEDLVDKPDDPDSIFWKLDFARWHMPAWWLPLGFDEKRDRTHLKLVNPENGSTIVGDSTTGDVGRGGRRTAIFLDEFASVENGYEVLKATRDNTNSRIFNSTPKGKRNAFHDMREKPETEVMTFLWVDHPEKAAGLYRSSEDGRLEVLDRSFVFPDGYPFVRDGKTRSPWYDEQCARSAHPQEIAQEIDINYQGGEFSFFWADALEGAKKRCCRPPLSVGELKYDEASADPLEYELRENGPLRLWVNPDAYGCIPKGGKYVIGADVGQGTGASDSAAVAFDRGTKEQVAELVTPFLAPDKFADACVALARWLNDAYLIWEANGPGVAFGQRVVADGYREIFYRRNERSIVKGRVTDTPGFFHNAENKMSNFVEFRRVLGRELSVRSDDLYEECRCYIHTTSGKIAHSRSENTIDPSGARDNHGDRVVGAVMAWRGIQELGEVGSEKSAECSGPPPGSMGARMERRRKRALAAQYW